MFTHIKDALHYIENRRVRHTFEYFKSVLDNENIDYSLPCIHVTGTNGKGGTLNYISYILREAGMKVGTFTSPYIVCHQDRFMINGDIMDDETLLDYINSNLEIIEKYNLAMFEIDFIIMLQYFKQQKVDIALIEVGIGGRNDKTNMISPIASIITNVGQDHLSQIGPTLLDVAYEKAGIIKQNTPSFISQMNDDITNIFIDEAKKKSSPLYIVDGIYEDVEGYYHQKNAYFAKMVVNTIFPQISEQTICLGLKKAKWPGRFERFSCGDAVIYLDGAHNLHAFDILLKTVEKQNFSQKPIFVYAALKDKDYQEMAGLIKEKGYILHVCKFNDGRALSDEEIASLNGEIVYESIEDAIEKMKLNRQMFIVCGSLHFISQFRNKIV